MQAISFITTYTYCLLCIFTFSRIGIYPRTVASLAYTSFKSCLIAVLNFGTPTESIHKNKDKLLLLLKVNVFKNGRVQSNTLLKFITCYKYDYQLKLPRQKIF